MRISQASHVMLTAVFAILLAACVVTVNPTTTPVMEEGIINGALGYPSDGIPPLRIFAIDVDSGDYYSIDTELNQKTYSLPVPSGSYHIFAYLLEEDSDFAGGYTEFVPCGLRADCPSHELIPVSVEAGETIEGIDPMDWYAPPGSFPSRPDAGSLETEATLIDLESHFLADMDLALVEADSFEGYNDIGFIPLRPTIGVGNGHSCRKLRSGRS